MDSLDKWERGDFSPFHLEREREKAGWVVGRFTLGARVNWRRNNQAQEQVALSDNGGIFEGSAKVQKK